MGEMPKDWKQVTALQELRGYASTCKRENLDGWMEGLARRLTTTCEAEGDPTVWSYDAKRGELTHTIKESETDE